MVWSTLAEADEMTVGLKATELIQFLCPGYECSSCAGQNVPELDDLIAAAGG